MNNKIKCFIFSWKGQYENACKLENQLKDLVDVTVINSEDENTPDHWVNIGNECYFSSQFKKALSLFDAEKYDFFFHVQADASSDQWENILKSAENSFEKYNWGVFAPNVDDTFYISARTDLFNVEENLTVVANTDNTCWIIHKDFINKLKQNINLMDGNELGWGWDLLICAFAHIDKRYVIRDYNYTISHPPSSNYKKDQAEREMLEMFEKTTDELRATIYFMKVDIRHLLNHYGVAENPSVFVYDTENV